ncbi:transcriptional repressor [Microbacterium sorbitolivorans]|uniref:Transcriptional repressor n=1 Tax=Microbacterium sorbitolivorans TaxID=1867410 RepID=A0A367XU94_9MICO|nr:Fur family transcriptional regulator [Microbacterium sorbitolivorans]RCK57193.1 transcriptional repressor [Microbacterium sorbitolivorans]GGF45886.1 transcriptional repressor [Microbacterium sorbitolivorans]
MAHTHAPVDAPTRLRGAGLRVTAQRVAVLEALSQTAHAAVDELHESVQREIPGIALQTVHGIVNDFTTAHVAQRVSLPGASSALYELARGDNHHHVQCIVCGRVEDVECVVGAAPCLTPSDAHGMRIVEAAVTFRGICEDCE